MTLKGVLLGASLAIPAFLATGRAEAGQMLSMKPVSGSLQVIAAGTANLFDKANGYLPQDTLAFTKGTTVNISDAAGDYAEFGFAEPANRAFVNFTDTQLVFTNKVNADAYNHEFVMTFISDAFANLNVVELSDNFYGNGLTSSLIGNVLTLRNGGGNVTAGQNFQAVFEFVPSIAPAAIVTPEPATVVFMASSLPIGLIYWIRRRKRATA